jgi:uncharacterized repeat protein (TIGR03803 family)
MAALDQVSDPRILRRKVEDIVLHDPCRHDQDRLRKDLLRRRRILDQFDQPVLEDDLAGETPTLTPTVKRSAPTGGLPAAALCQSSSRFWAPRRKLTPPGGDGGGTVFEIVKTAGGYASVPTTLVNFCSLANCADGSSPIAGLIADAKGNLFGTTAAGGANHGGTVFEVTNSGFIVKPIFAGTPGKPNCFGQSVSALAKQYGGLNTAAAALGFDSVQALQEAIREFCEG